MVIKPAFGTFGSVGRCQVLLENEISIFKKLVSRRKHDVFNFAFNMLWYSTPWTASPFSNDPLWHSLFVEGVNDCLLDQCQVSSDPHFCGFKEQEIPRIYTVWMIIYWNSNVNILIFWDTDFYLSLPVNSNHQNKKNKKNFWSVLKWFTRRGAVEA